MKDCKRRYFNPIAFAFLIFASPAFAAEVNVIGLFDGKALVSINGGRQQMMRVGQRTPEGVQLLSADSGSATFEIDGRRQTLTLGRAASRGPEPSGKPTAVLSADAQGHFVTTGSINGKPVQFLVDTGASMITLGSADAKRLGISYLEGERGQSITASGTVPAYKISLDNVRVGNIVLNQVETIVLEDGNLPVALLGMSFLNRLEMRREGTTLTLIKQY